MLDASPPPPKPPDENIVRKIETFCQLIAKNGPGIEDVTRQNESGNPEFEFLFGGEAGSGAAIAHEYFLWMKKKCDLACKLHEGSNESPLVIDSSSQCEHLNASSGYSVPADSDMEMEDDITVFDRDQGDSDSIEALNCKYDEELDLKTQLHRPQSTRERRTAPDVSCERVSNLLFEQGQSASRVDYIYLSGAAECPSASDLEKSSIPIADDQNTLSAPAASEANNSDRFSNQVTKVGSPFSLLKEYASDNSSENDDEAFVEDVNVKTVPASVTAVSKSTHKDIESPCMTNEESRRPSESKKPYKEKDASDGAGVDVASRRGESQEGIKAKFESVPSKVDEFGRLVRDGSSDSNSEEDSHYTKRHNRRGRSRIHSRSRSRSRIRSRSRNCNRSCSQNRNRSRSPLNSRRRSSRRRREKRSRSRSRSSRYQRSRSRSPTFRRAGEFRDDSKRQDRRHIPECFDFLRGRCYRGASCRYMHREYDKNDSSGNHRSKQKHLEIQPSLKSSRIKKEIKHSTDMNVHDEIKAQEFQLPQDVPVARKDGQLIDSDKIKCESSSMAADTMQVKQILPEKPEETSTHIPEIKEFQEVLNSHYSQLISSADNMKSCDNSVVQPQKVSSGEPLPNAIFSPHMWPMKSSNGQPLSSEQFSSQFIAPNSKELPLPSSSGANNPYLSQLPPPPPPPPPPPSQGSTNAVHAAQLHRDYNLMPSYPLQSTPPGSIHSYQDSLPNQCAQFSLLPDSRRTSLPPPPPRPPYDSTLNTGTATQGVSSQFQQNHLIPRNDFGSQTSVRPSHSQAGEFLLQMYPPAREFPHPGLHREDFGSGNPSSQPFGGPGLTREDHFTHAPAQDLNSSNAFAHSNIHPQPAPPRELPVNKMQNFSGDNFPSGELLNSSVQINPHSHNQQPTYGMQYPVGDGVLCMPGRTGGQYPVGDSILGFPGKDSSLSRHPTDSLDRNQLSRLSDFGASRISTHHNPYAATFEQTQSSKFSYNSLNQESNAPSGNIYDTPPILSQVPVDGQGVGSVGSRQTTSSPSSARVVGQLLPKSESEQYDPLLDSIEPSSTPLNESSHVRKQKTASDSNVMSLSGSCQPLDVEENNKHKEVATVASATSLDMDEYGETADAEAGVVEDESLSDPEGAENMATGEIGIDQVDSQGKNKKEKDSRSMRLFKSAVADFVKEMLKPSWRQGNMSKEAFKTIVKKTVDKVSGAMKKHQIPKSQAKIDHYIDSSQRKLTKLVKGYLDKYVKV